MLFRSGRLHAAGEWPCARESEIVFGVEGVEVVGCVEAFDRDARGRLEALASFGGALERAGRLDRAIYVERGTMTNAAVIPLADKLDTAAPYFAMVLVPGWEERA